MDEDRMLVTGIRAWRGSAPAATAMMVHGDRLTAIGDAALTAGAEMRRTRRVDFDGRWVTPGIVDAHVHPLAAQLQTEGARVSPHSTVEDCWDAVRSAVRSDPGWAVIAGYSAILFATERITRHDLDRIEARRPVVLINNDQHGALANSAALAAAGLSGGSAHVETDDRGEPTGYVNETAISVLLSAAPGPTPPSQEAALLRAQAELHAMGVTAWQDAFLGDGLGMPDATAAYRALAGRGSLTARVTGALGWDRSLGLEQIPGLLERRRDAPAGRLSAPAVKFFLDGVHETGTAAMLAEYFDVDGRPLGHNGGTMIPPDLLAKAVVQLDAAKVDIHVHAVGDRAVRTALDAIEQARQRNGVTGARHQIAHVMFVGDGDVPRFAMNDVTMNIQPVWAADDYLDFDQYERYVGAEPMARLSRLADWERSGARLAFGSDWPVSTPDPREGIHAAVHRSLVHDSVARFGGQALTPTQAWNAYTRGSAWAAHIDDVGCLQPGMLADFVVWDGDPIAAPRDARVHQTWIGGEIVYSADQP